MSEIQKKRDFEKLTYQRDMFWHESGKQELIARLLQKIYDLQDEIEKIKIKLEKKEIINNN